MGKGYLIDSNVIIDFCNGKLPANARKLLEAIEPEISIVTNIELFATKNISEREHFLLAEFVAIAVVRPVNTDIVPTTIDIRKNYRLKLPDAIIAATALVLNATLLSRNISDFKNVEGLEIIDPYNL